MYRCYARRLSTGIQQVRGGETNGDVRAYRAERTDGPDANDTNTELPETGAARRTGPNDFDRGGVVAVSVVTVTVVVVAAVTVVPVKVGRRRRCCARVITLTFVYLWPAAACMYDVPWPSPPTMVYIIYDGVGPIPADLATTTTTYPRPRGVIYLRLFSYLLPAMSEYTRNTKGIHSVRPAAVLCVRVQPPRTNIQWTREDGCRRRCRRYLSLNRWTGWGACV